MKSRHVVMGLVGLLAPGCSAYRFGGPSGPPAGTYEERIDTFSKLLAMEDRRAYDPLLSGRAASSPDPWLRAKTALALGRLRDPEATVYLPVLLRDEELLVRRAATFGAGLSGDERLVRFLEPALADADAGTAVNAADALGKLGGEGAGAALLGAAEGASGPRGAFLLALWRASSPRLVGRLAPLARDGPGEARRAAVYALARRPVSEAAPVLRRALGDQDPELVAYAARGLGVLGDAEAMLELAGLAWSREPSVAIQSLLALEKIGAKTPLPASARTAALARTGDHVPGVSVAAVRLLRRFAAETGVASRLLEIATEGGWRGQTALVSLAAGGSPAASGALGAAVASGSLERRLGVAEAVALLPAQAALALARRLQTDPAPRVRATALSSLTREALEGEPDVLLGPLGDPDAAVRSAALEAGAPLPLSGAAQAAWKAAFESCLTEKEPDYVVSALDALAERPGDGRARLEALAEDSQAVVREKARRLLQEKYKVPAASFHRIPVQTRYEKADYRRIARAVNETRLWANVQTSRGGFEMDLLFEDAPLTVQSFRELAGRRFFDGILIHRVVPDFVVQTGDPRGDGTGGPGYAIRDEINPQRYVRGAVGMALSGPDTGGSQWFVALSPQPHLDGGYTVFGAVTSYIEVLDRVEQDDRLVAVEVHEEMREPPPGTRPAAEARR